MGERLLARRKQQQASRRLMAGKSAPRKGWSRAVSPLQRSLHSTLGCLPATAGSAQFCLLCCQPEPVPESLPARPPPLTRGYPCRLPVWSGQPIHMVCRMYSGPRHFINHISTWKTGRHEPPRMIESIYAIASDNSATGVQPGDQHSHRLR